MEEHKSIHKERTEHTSPIKITYFKTSYGELIMGSFRGALCLCDWRYRRMRTTVDKRIQKGAGVGVGYKEESCKVVEEAKKQLTEYFSGARKVFDIPLLLIGTDFQKTVWEELLKLPYGKTSSYMALSKKLENTKAIRAVASANGANAISIIVPCHRIVGSNGDLVGYAGGLPAKKKLLYLENALDKNQLSLF